MAESTAGVLIGVLAVAGAAYLLYHAWTASARLGPFRPRAKIEPARLGPVGELVASGVQHTVFAHHIDAEVRAQLLAFAQDRSIPAAEIPAAVADGRLTLPPLVLRSLEPGAQEAWAKERALSRYTGPRPFFFLWAIFARATESREAITIRYLDALTKELEEMLTA